MARTPSLKGLRPMHPGEMLREDVLPALGRSKVEIASLLGVSRQTLHDGNGPDLWISMQRAFDLHKAEAALARELAAIPTLKVA
jgi:antitoxin HigA-1